MPVLRAGPLVVWDTLAIFEHLHEAHGGVWPDDAVARARARSLAAEVHAGMNALRAAMPVNTRARRRKAKLTPEAEAEIGRVAEVWSAAEAPWLFGAFGGADIMFAPIATRFQTYGVTLAGTAQAYGERLLGHPLVAEWLALAETDVIPLLEVG